MSYSIEQLELHTIYSYSTADYDAALVMMCKLASKFSMQSASVSKDGDQVKI